MKTINTFRYTGSNHISLIAHAKENPELLDTVHVTCLSNEEAETQLKADISAQIEGDFELSIKDVPKTVFTNLSTPRLLKLYEKTEGMLGAKEMMETILIKRGAISIAEESEEPVKGEDEKPAREYKKCMTEECLQNRLAEARKNYRRWCRFLCTKDKEEHYGLIRSARLDKRSGFIQYRIEIVAAPSYDLPYEMTGKVYGKGDDSKDLIIYDIKPSFITLVGDTPKEEYTKEDAERMNETVANA